MAMLWACSEDESEVIPSSNTIALLGTTSTIIEGESGKFSAIFVGNPADLTSDVTVDYSVTSEGFEDFTGSFVIPADEARDTFEIAMPENKLFSTDTDTLSVTLTLTGASGGFAINENTPQNSHTFSLIDDTKIISILDSDASISELFSEEGDTLKVPITIPNSLDGEVTVDYTISGTADEGDDYTLLSDASLVLPAGTGDTTINIIVNDDLGLETGGETIIVTLNDVTPTDTDDEETFLTDSTKWQSITYTIEDDLKTFSFERVPTDTIIFESPGSVDITILLSGEITAAGLVGFNFDLPAGMTVGLVGPSTIFGAGQNSSAFELNATAAAFTGSGTEITGSIEMVATDSQVGDSEIVLDAENIRINFKIIDPAP